MARIDYNLLYKLQDRVLSVVFNVEKEFYLSGGTCLSRFYLEKRYSDDLDFFADHSSRFGFAVKNIRIALGKTFKLLPIVESKDFFRFQIDNLLQLDFVNDHAPRLKDIIVTDDGFLIDNPDNILSNKLTAVIGRDNPKDLFDIYLICTFHSFSWDKILESAHQKAGFSDEDLITRLKTFPAALLKRIHCIDPHFLDNFDTAISLIIEEIIQKTQHLAKNI